MSPGSVSKITIRNIVNWSGRLLAIGALFLLAEQLVKNAQQIPSIRFSVYSLSTIAVGLLFYVIYQVGNAYIWKTIIKGGGIEISLREAVIIYGKAQIGKYLPGNVFHIVGQFALSRKRGLKSEPVAISIGVQTIITACVPLAIGIVGIYFDKTLGVWIASFIGPKYKILFAILGAAALLCAFFLICRPKFRAWLYSRRRYLALGRLTVTTVLTAVAFFGLGLLVQNLEHSLWGVGYSTPLSRNTLAFSLAWVLGFITPGAPGGLGVREAVFVALLSNDLGVGLAIGLAVALRILTSLGDVFIFIVALSLDKLAKRQATTYSP